MRTATRLVPNKHEQKPMEEETKNEGNSFIQVYIENTDVEI